MLGVPVADFLTAAQLVQAFPALDPAVVAVGAVPGVAHAQVVDRASAAVAGTIPNYTYTYL